MAGTSWWPLTATPTPYRSLSQSRRMVGARIGGTTGPTGQTRAEARHHRQGRTESSRGDLRRPERCGRQAARPHAQPAYPDERSARPSSRSFSVATRSSSGSSEAIIADRAPAISLFVPFRARPLCVRDDAAAGDRIGDQAVTEGARCLRRKRKPETGSETAQQLVPGQRRPANFCGQLGSSIASRADCRLFGRWSWRSERHGNPSCLLAPPCWQRSARHWLVGPR